MTAYLETVNNVLQNLPNYINDCIPHKKTPIPPAAALKIACEEMRWIVRLAGVSGAAAVGFGAYGAHVIRDNPEMEERRIKAFDTGSRYHLIHSLALLASGKAKYPAITAALFGGGILLFCGPCYHYSITGKETYRQFTPKGGVLFILGWLSLIL